MLIARHWMRRRRGLTLIELMISLSLAGVMLALFAALSARQQRIFADMSDRVSLAGQLREAAAIVPIDLRALAPAAGDVRDARDTSLELRATIGSAIICDSAANSATLAPAASGATTFASFAAPADAGDTAWVLAAPDSVQRWQAYRIGAAVSVSGGACAAGGPRADSSASATRVRLSLDGAAAMPIGSPVRITRPVRYSLYRASDNQWYFGERDWNTTTARFNTIQPVAGPFLSAAAGGLAFAYFDSTGAELSSPVADPRSIALIRARLIGQTRAVIRALGAAGSGSSASRRVDTAIVAAALRNRR